MGMTGMYNWKTRNMPRRLPGVAVFLLATAGMPTVAQALVCNGQFDITYRGICSTTTTQSCFANADCPLGETCNIFTFAVPGEATRDTLRVHLAVGAGNISTGTVTNQLTVNRVRFELDCVAPGGVPCTDQGNVVNYLGDATISTDCPGVAWSSTLNGANELVFSHTGALVIQPNTPPGDLAGGGCSLEFNIEVVNPEPTAG